MTKQHDRVDSLDFLRGIAIFAVISFHTLGIFGGPSAIEQPAKYGFFGVQLFFLISAITMCMMWERRSGEGSPALKFYIRRFCRIAGPFWLAIPVYLWLAPPGLTNNAPEGIGRSEVLSSALFVHTLWPGWIDSIVEGGWSIGVEMLFYAFFPLLVWVNGSARFYLSCAFALYLFNLLIVHPAGASFLVNYPNPISTDNFLDRNLIAQGPTFLVGIAVHKSLHGRLGWWEAAIAGAWIAVTLIAKAFGLRAAAPTYWFAVLAMAALVRFVVLKKAAWSPLTRLGTMSYSIYLSHFAILFGISAAFAQLGLPHHRLWAFYFSLVLVTVSSATLGVILRATVEQPSTEIGRWLVGLIAANTSENLDKETDCHTGVAP